MENNMTFLEYREEFSNVFRVASDHFGIREILVKIVLKNRFLLWIEWIMITTLVSMPCYSDAIKWKQNPDGLRITMPNEEPCDYSYAFKIIFKNRQ
jgi:hypothetical protein